MSISAGKVVIAGGSGFLGQALSASLLQDGYEVVILGRGNKSGLRGEFVKWDAKTMGSWCQQLEGALALFNLTGRSIDCRYTEKNKALILNSRVDSTQILGEAIKNVWNLRRSGSMPARQRFTRISVEIYNLTMKTVRPMRKVLPRMWGGLGKKYFLSHRGRGSPSRHAHQYCSGKRRGAFPVLRRLTRFGLGGRQGPGNQWMSWLHLDDWVGIAKFLMTNPQISGPVNLACPGPVTNAQFMKAMRKEFAPLELVFRHLPQPYSWGR